MNRCVGCGAILQDTDPKKDGYVYSRELSLCMRCFKIKNYGENLKIDKTNDDYIKILNGINDDDIVVYVSSLLTLNLSLLRKFKNVLLVLTKRDVLPKSVKDVKIINYIRNRYNNISDIVIVSSFKKYNLDILYNKLLKYKNKNIYFVGMTNSGKSTLINELMKSYTGVDGTITTSNYPSTTIDIVTRKIGKLFVIDTPGIVVKDSIINFLDNKGIKKINNKKEIKPVTMQIKGNGSVLVGDYFRLDYETGESSLTFYVSNGIDVSKISLKNTVLIDACKREFMIPDNSDLVIEDFGFVKVTNGIKVKLYSNVLFNINVRDKLI